MSYEELNPVQKFATDVLVKDALSKMKLSILKDKLKGLQYMETQMDLDSVHELELNFVRSELAARVRKEGISFLGKVLYLNFVTTPEDTVIFFCDDILPGKFIVGICIIWPFGRSTKIDGHIIPLMFSEHGLFASLEEIDARSPMRLMRLVQAWNRETPIVCSVGTPVLADLDDAFQDINAFANKIRDLAVGRNLYYSGQPLIDLRVKEEKQDENTGNPESAEPS